MSPRILRRKRRTTKKSGHTRLFVLLAIVGLVLVSFVASEMAGIHAPIMPTPIPVSSALVPAATARLIIPKIGVDAIIRDMGVTMGGAMALPGNRTDVGWFKFGAHPGEIGSAVIGGHNWWNNGVGAFARLNQLEIGDIVLITGANGRTTSFVVRNMRTFDAADTDTGIFESVSGAHLNLITCSGVWNSKTKSYTTRLVVFTDAMTVARR